MGGIIVTSTTVSVSSRLTAIRQGLSRGEWVRVAGMAATVIGLFALGLTMMLIASRSHYHLSKTQLFGAGTGLLALTLGMRHAFDADHISAIDNTTRKLMAEGKRPMSVGFFFSLGHSTIVFIMALLLNFGIRALDDQVKNDSSALHNITGIIGTSVSGTFLYLIAGLNIVILASIRWSVSSNSGG
jgi:high-affinity nickel-transport protein